MPEGSDEAKDGSGIVGDGLIRENLVLRVHHANLNKGVWHENCKVTTSMSFLPLVEMTFLIVTVFAIVATCRRTDKLANGQWQVSMLRSQFACRTWAIYF